MQGGTIKTNTPNRVKPYTILSVERVKMFLDLMSEGVRLEEAAKQAKIRCKRARLLFRDPAILKEYNQRLDVIRTGEKARNLHAMIQTRELAFDAGATAAQRKVALEAIRMLEGEAQGGITINGGQNVIAGYVIKLDGEAEGPKAIGNRSVVDAKPLELQARVTDDDE
jgi:hypothetical protein